MQGARFQADYGISDEGDGDNRHTGFAFGSDFAGGAGHFVVGAELERQDAINDCSSARDWCGASRGFFANGTGGGPFDPLPSHPYVPLIDGQPHNIIMDDLRNSSSEYGWVFNNVPGTTSYRFNDAGNDLVPYNPGAYAHAGPLARAIGGEGKSIYDQLTLIPEQKRDVVMAHASYEFTPSLTGFVEASWGEVDAWNRQYGAEPNSTVMCIQADNAFLLQGSDAMRAEIAARAGNAPANCFNGGTAVVKDFVGEVGQLVATNTEVARTTVGLSGEFLNGWAWDAYYQYGKTERSQVLSGSRSNHRFQMAVDSVVGADGRVHCRVNVEGLSALPWGADPSLAEGCVAVNPFGRGQLSAEAEAYAFGSLVEMNEIEQHVAAFNASGELWEGLGYGALMAAGGVEFRYEEMINDAGDLPTAQRTDFALQYGDSFGGEVEVLEYFAELEMPLLADAPLVDRLMLNVAARRAEYSNTGGLNTTGATEDRGMTSWKTSLVWDPARWLRVRGSISQDVRAAGFRELYYAQTVGAGGMFGSVTNPWLPDTGAMSQYDETGFILSGNPALKQETAKTKTMVSW